MEIKRPPSITANLLIILILLAVGIFAGFFLNSTLRDRCLKTHEYINKDFSYGKTVYTVRKSSYAPFRQELISLIDSEKEAGAVLAVSVFFRDLRAGPTFGINDFENFAPASLLKVPLALAYLRFEEENPGILESVIRYTKDGDILEQTFKPSKSIKKNETYTIEEILFHMVAYSDNVSFGVLSDYIKTLPNGGKFLSQVYQELGVINPRDAAQESVTVHGYASIFRQLYNVSYLNVELSEKLLSWLAQSDFKEGIVAGVPASVKVAHKFGERLIVEQSTDKEIKQLHDCGIVYFPNNPYILCIMTRGREWKDLTRVIKTISEKIYKEVESRRL